MIDAVNAYLGSMKRLEIPCPIVVLMGIAGAIGAVADEGEGEGGAPIDRELLLFPDLLIEEYGSDVPRALRPLFDTLWNALGYERSPNYDPNDNWIRRSQ